jgi:hypothetical protein
MPPDSTFWVKRFITDLRMKGGSTALLHSVATCCQCRRSVGDRGAALPRRSISVPAERDHSHWLTLAAGAADASGTQRPGAPASRAEARSGSLRRTENIGGGRRRGAAMGTLRPVRAPAPDPMPFAPRATHARRDRGIGRPNRHGANDRSERERAHLTPQRLR